jgi:hypothetical protein
MLLYSKYAGKPLCDWETHEKCAIVK